MINGDGDSVQNIMISRLSECCPRLQWTTHAEDDFPMQLYIFLHVCRSCGRTVYMASTAHGGCGAR